ncbi:hypothetical protein EID71_09705 [Salmonella enterica subsp. indica serovar 11:b:e,n,x]|nr:hypothetical protein [Salmonella enterica subsp. indica serovar 11:b:e,n,x]
MICVINFSRSILVLLIFIKELFDHVWPLKDSFWGHFIACFLSNKCAFFSTKNVLYVILPWPRKCLGFRQPSVVFAELRMAA